MEKTINFLTRKQYSGLFFASTILVSLGILIVTIGGSWDVTSHLLNRPETFFSPSHTILYTGVAIALASTVIKFFSWKNLPDETKSQHAKQVKLAILGIAVLVVVVVVVGMEVKVEVVFDLETLEVVALVFG
ncbi:MAG: hypothetical protein HYZ56_05845 [Nitrosopumilales archaeon]|nr:hypothetical protein [Nitrosopumilales archaeon]